jgi:hypothetical protein
MGTVTLYRPRHTVTVASQALAEASLEIVDAQLTIIDVLSRLAACHEALRNPLRPALAAATRARAEGRGLAEIAESPTGRAA